MSDEMYPNVRVSHLIWSRKHDSDWPLIDNISCVLIVTSMLYWTPADAEFVLKL